MWKKYKEIKDDKDRIIKDVERARRKTFDRAVNLLTYKPRSVKELQTRLMEKEWTNSAIVEEVIKKLESYGYLNDAQFAKNFAAAKIRQKPIGKRVLQQKMAMKKLDKETVAEAIEKAFEETPESEIIDRAIEKRLRVKGNPTERADVKKFYDFLLRQGFSYDLVSSKMREIAARDFDENE
ncbi:regulatory protein RecX [soil metagenome]